MFHVAPALAGVNFSDQRHFSFPVIEVAAEQDDWQKAAIPAHTPELTLFCGTLACPDALQIKASRAACDIACRCASDTGSISGV